MTDTQLNWLDYLENDRQTLPEDDHVKTLEHLAKMYEEAEAIIAGLEQQLARAQKQFEVIREDLIPDKMMEFGVKELKLDDGSKLSYKPFYGGKLLKEEGYDWLEEQGYPGAVKQELKLEVSRQDKATLELIKNFILKRELGNLSIKEKQSIHHMTLGNLVKTLSKQGKQLPNDMFEVYIGNRATLQRGKIDA